MKLQRGFTLIELMVVIVIIGILSALAVPKMFGTSAKAKAAEAPGVIANWETLESAYSQEKGAPGDYGQIGFKDPSADSKWFDYQDGTGTITAVVQVTFGECNAVGTPDTFVSVYDAVTDVAAHSATGNCAPTYAVNFMP